MLNQSKQPSYCVIDSVVLILIPPQRRLIHGGPISVYCTLLGSLKSWKAELNLLCNNRRNTHYCKWATRPAKTRASQSWITCLTLKPWAKPCIFDLAAVCGTDIANHLSLWHMLKCLETSLRYSPATWCGYVNKAYKRADRYVLVGQRQNPLMKVAVRSEEWGRISTRLCETKPSQRCLHANTVSLTTAKSLAYLHNSKALCLWLASHSPHSCSISQYVPPCSEISKPLL